MTPTDLSNLRLINQQITTSKFTTAKSLVGWMGAIQAQDVHMSQWAIGVRLPNATDKVIKSAIDAGEIIRTHLLRPTWHFVSADDIHWMLDLTAPQIRRIVKLRDKNLELNETIYKKSAAIIEKSLAGNNHLTREELVAQFVAAGIAVDSNRASHLLLRAEIDGILCSGKTKSDKQTYALLHEWVPKTRTYDRREALAMLARRYFTSHCPATLADFVWWSGLTVKEATQTLEMVKPSFVSETIDGQTYWLSDSLTLPKQAQDSVYFLPAFDEFIISYKDRTASLPADHHAKAVSNNGIFRPIIVLNGQIIGIWKRTVKKDTVLLETTFFNPPGEASEAGIIRSFAPYAHFIGKKVEV